MRWKAIPGICYKVSEYGDIKRTIICPNGRGSKPLKHRLDRNGYHSVLMRCDGKHENKYVHRLVAEAFVENPRGFHEVNHLDGYKANNYYLNLMWVSHEWNMQHAAMEHKFNKKLNEKDVKEIKLTLKTSPDISREELAKYYKISKSTIGDIIAGRTWKYVIL